MTAHIHDPATHGGGVPAPNSSGRVSKAQSRSRWLLPGLLVALLVGGLVAAGVISLSTVIYAGLLGGMMLMHLGGHGHGGHGGGGHGGRGASGHEGHSSATNDADDLSRRSSDSQPSTSGSAAGLDEGAPDDSATGEKDHDQHSSHDCH